MKFWQVDAFTHEIFCGNPAAVFIFDQEPSDRLMMNIAREMNLSETAFVIKGSDLKIRWFTPNTEVDLCGHATLAAAHILWAEGVITGDEIIFQSRSGALHVLKNEKGYTLNFPLQPPREKKEYTEKITKLLGVVPEHIGSNNQDCMAVVTDDAIVHSFIPNHSEMAFLEERGFLLTAQDHSGKYDYIYRGFFPKLDVPEDPVTGSANTCLAAYWSKRLGKKKLRARQVSDRGGDLDLEVSANRVLISGNAVTVFEGQMHIKQSNF